jgi:hypothetical protein
MCRSFFPRIPEGAMNGNRIPKTWIAGVMLAVLAVSLVAPIAEARHTGQWHRYKDRDYTGAPRGAAHGRAAARVFVSHRSSSVGPAIAGFIGGLALGAVLSRASEPGYEYHDPYCRERFATLEIYRSHLHRCHHPRIVRVIEISSGECVHTCRWQDGGWVDGDGDPDGDWED